MSFSERIRFCIGSGAQDVNRARHGRIHRAFRPPPGRDILGLVATSGQRR
jgi:hypothetical protein